MGNPTSTSLPIGGVSTIPKRKGPYTPVVWPKHGQAVHGIAVNRTIVHALTHWVNERSGPCFGKWNGCACCNLGWGPRWCGYLGCLDVSLGRVFVAQVSLNAARTAPLLVQEGFELRGNQIHLYRCGTGPQSRVHGEIIPGPDSKVLPAEFDVKPHLFELWGKLPADENPVWALAKKKGALINA